MPVTAEDLVPLGKVRASLTALAEDARAGREKIITRNGEAYVALVDARRLDAYHRLERELAHQQLLVDAAQGLHDVQTGDTLTPSQLDRKLKRKLQPPD